MRFLVCVAFILLSAAQLFAWHTNTHVQMTRDAISLMPEDFQMELFAHKKYVVSGIMDPDELLRDWENHFYIPSLPPSGGAMNRIEKLIALIQDRLQKPALGDTGKQLCYLAHYIGDLWSPESHLKQNCREGPDFLLNNRIVVVWEGYDKPIDNFQEHFKQRAQWRWKIENSHKVATLLYNEAVNDIAGVWLSLWQGRNKSVQPLQRRILEHKRDALIVQPKSSSSSSSKSIWESQFYTQKWRTSTYTRRADLRAAVAARNDKAFLSRIQPTNPFVVLEASLKSLQTNSFLVIRLRAEKDISSISLMYPGHRGAIATAVEVPSGEVVKLEGTLPTHAKKDQIEIIFGSPE
ncbi:hypothetical protein L0222_28685 [bacterium]|nr:hypothetical protein [bacterium]MCI0604100.1 hypothetical protein [bacterium]